VADYDKHLGNVRHSTIEEIWNNDAYREMRIRMLSGKECSQCSGCYAAEAAGNKSTRMHVNGKYQQHVNLAELTNADGSLDAMNLRHFDVRWSNICNFKCRSCSSTYSSTWAQEDNAQGANKPVFIMADGNNNDRLYEQFLPHFESIETFYFAGGEPLLTDKHYDILEHLIAIGRTGVRLEYNTNLSSLKYKNKSIVALWKQFENVNVWASLDSYGDRAEYIREGTDWQLIETNIKLIRQECPHVVLGSSTVISAFNLHTITEFLDHMLAARLYDVDSWNPSFYNIQNPTHFSADIFDTVEKELIVSKIQGRKYSASIDEQLGNVINYVRAAHHKPELRTQFINDARHYDGIRQRELAKTFPELVGLLQ
jgi:sulfatase maturation enzyme AslB (radical SAM superfamily)